MGLKYKFEHDLDSAERTIKHRDIILEKPFLKKLYLEWYQVFMKEIPHLPEGEMVELGSGGGFLKQVNPDILSSDILPLPFTDLTFSALEMPFSDNTLSAIFMIDTLHHIPMINKFFQECRRTLKPGGAIVMIEPANSAWGRFIYQNFHHEPFVPASDWNIPDEGPLSGANGALPWIIFERDRDKFEALYPELKIRQIKYHTPFRYLLSGGVSYKSLAPGFMFALFTALDRLSSNILPQLSMFTTIKLLKQG
ncbi:MAG: class I SAM-dependent methyltransferase [Cyclobacteriaceae bacterium]